MSSSAPGTVTSPVEVVHISQHGIWLAVHDAEYLLPFEDFPWFRDATVSQIQRVELVSPSHLHWPDLDVDLHTESLAEPERYPLVADAPG